MKNWIKLKKIIKERWEVQREDFYDFLPKFSGFILGIIASFPILLSSEKIGIRLLGAWAIFGFIDYIAARILTESAYKKFDRSAGFGGISGILFAAIVLLYYAYKQSLI